jgi:hypothetical protein
LDLREEVYFFQYLEVVSVELLEGFVVESARVRCLHSCLLYGDFLLSISFPCGLSSHYMLWSVVAVTTTGSGCGVGGLWWGCGSVGPLRLCFACALLFFRPGLRPLGIERGSPEPASAGEHGGGSLRALGGEGFRQSGAGRGATERARAAQHREGAEGRGQWERAEGRVGRARGAGVGTIFLQPSRARLKMMRAL